MNANEQSIITNAAGFDFDRPEYSVADWCRITHVSRSWLMCHLSETPHKRVGRFIRFSRRDVAQFLEQISRGVRGAA